LFVIPYDNGIPNDAWPRPAHQYGMCPSILSLVFVSHN
jgi:hypothetical protein